MTDKELLALSAKAAGYTQTWNEFWRGMYNELPNDCWDSSSYWNPLTDDGDALRLAVTLDLDVVPSMRGRSSFRYARVDGKTYTELDADPYAATRRAIVRAAAEVGKGMLSQDEFILMFPGRFDEETVERAAAAIGKDMK
jgi:hypothetical protein